MTIPKLQRSTFWFVAIAMLIVLTDMIAVRTISFAEEDPVMVYAVMFDLMLVVPFLCWLLVLRKKGKSIAKIVAFPLLGALTAWLVLPPSQRGMVWNAVWPVELLLVAAELAFIGYEIRIVYRLVKGFLKVSRQEPDTAEALRIAVHDRIGKGKLASLLLHDASLAYYLLFSWRRKSNSDPSGGASLYSYHKRTNQVLYSAIFTKIILIEGIVVHLLLQQWSHWAAWIFTIADLWLLAIIWGDCRASILQPVKLAGGTLRLRYGLRIQADIPMEDIANVASEREYHPDPREQRHAALPLLGTPNIRIELKQPLKVNGILFLPRTVTLIFLALDEPDAFVRKIELGLNG